MIFSRCKSLKHLVVTFSIRRYAKVPPEPTWKPVDKSQDSDETDVTTSLVDHLERLSLVEFGNQEGVQRLREAVKFADQLLDVDTTGTDPMDSVLEKRALYLREDKVTEGNQKKDILSNAKKVIENYFVAPPGNIPLPKKEKDYG